MFHLPATTKSTVTGFTYCDHMACAIATVAGIASRHGASVADTAASTMASLIADYFSTDADTVLREITANAKRVA